MSGGLHSAQMVESAACPAEDSCRIAAAGSWPAAAEVGALQKPRGGQGTEEESKELSSVGQGLEKSTTVHDSLREISYRSFLFPQNKEIFEDAAAARPDGEKTREETLAAAAFELSRVELLRPAPLILLPHCQLILLSFKYSHQARAALAALCVEERGRRPVAQQQQHRVLFLVGVRSSSGDSDGVDSSGSPRQQQVARSSGSGESLRTAANAAAAAATAATQKEVKDTSKNSQEPCSAFTQAESGICWQLWNDQKEQDVCPVAAVVIFATEPRLLRKKANFYLNLVSLQNEGGEDTMTEGRTKRASSAAADGEAAEIGGPEAKKHSPSKLEISPHDDLCIKTIRCLGADMPTLAKSGHPGAPMGMAPVAHALWGYVMRQCGKHPEWINRDRFVLSNGHACALLYSMLHLSGYDMTIEDLRQFRQLRSKTPGHPEVKYAAGIETTTGPLGQGISNAVGMAIGAHHLAAKYNKKDFPSLFDSRVYVCCGDGCLEEGIASEACSLAGHLGLSRLIVLYDENKITIDGGIDLSFSENVPKRFEAYGWHVEVVQDGDHDVQSIVKALEEAKARTDKPTLLCVRTTIGYLSAKAGSEKAHGSPLSPEEVKNVKKKCGLDPDLVLQIPEPVRLFYEEVQQKRELEVKDWQRRFSEYKAKYPQEGMELEAMFSRKVPAAALEALQTLVKETKAKADSTRAHSGRALNAIKDYLPDLIGGSADLTGSTCTALKGEGHISAGHFTERSIYFGVREHAMLAICNGLWHFGCFRPFAATFLNFITYGWGALRLAALSHCGCLVIATHDSIELGQDGPTHQPVEVLPLCRATPNLLLLRPADASEVAGAYAVWLKNTQGPTVLSLCRSSVPALDGTSFEGVAAGAYVLSDFENNGRRKILLAGSGSELHFCVETKKLLQQQGSWDVRLVSMPSWRLLEKQQQSYREATLCMSARKSGEILTVYVEAATPWGWDRYFDLHIGMTSFGESAPGSAVYDYFGFTPEKIARRIEEYSQQFLNDRVSENVNEKAT